MGEASYGFLDKKLNIQAVLKMAYSMMWKASISAHSTHTKEGLKGAGRMDTAGWIPLKHKVRVKILSVWEDSKSFSKMTNSSRRKCER